MKQRRITKMKIPKLKLPGLDDLRQVKDNLFAIVDYHADILKTRFDEINRDTEEKKKKIMEK